MLSRLATRAVASPWGRPVSSRTVSTTGTALQQKENPERDLVNFPKRKRPLDRPAVRHQFIPEEFFQMFHSKTGVTGPYMFIGGVTTYILSKEIWVIEHEFWAGLSLIGVLAGVLKLVGPQATAAINASMDAEELKLKSIRQDEIDRCKDAITGEDKAQWMATSYKELIVAKKENVGLQLEAAYRERLHDAYTQVKKRLDYQLEVSNVMRRTEQKHMVDWIISNVRKSITAKQEDDALKKCISDLKSLAVAK